ncbi:MAG: membrane protein insertase YidC [Termitinemataceae bacterium]|nr:MAG: membrane protein insertase YidC [Termitinemataceae bacterium]
MEKNTILAIVLSVVVIVGFSVVQATFFPKNVITQDKVLQTQSGQSSPVTPSGITALGEAQDQSENSRAAIASGGSINQPEKSAQEMAIDEDFPTAEEISSIETPLLFVDFTNSGGDVRSFKLKNHKNGDDFVDMILGGSGEPHAFSLAFGGKTAKPEQVFFKTNKISDTSIEFYRDFLSNGKKFRLTKTYSFKPNEYMFELIVTIDGGTEIPAINFAAEGNFFASYTLGFGPQIGPHFEALDERYDYRHYVSYINGKQKQEKVSDKQDATINSRFSWLAIAGKYFVFIAVPDTVQHQAVFSTKPDTEGLSTSSRLYLERPALQASRTIDTYRFYLGPKTQGELAKYDNGDNGFGYTELRIEKISNASGFWGILNPLERALKWILTLFFKIIHNYGAAIILVTIVVKVLLFPLTKKSSESTIRMQVVAPKIKELQAKYKDNPQKMNIEMAALYKKEGYNPLSGCLPMLIQMPIFLAMYNLFNNHFELRGAMFLPGWIPDLSLPETIWNFAPFRLPILGWSDLRLLPFIYVASQLLYGKVTQTPDQAGNTQMKVMLYAMPIVFFFVLYNVPSGLLIYWIMSNVLTLVQQLIINKIMAPQKAAMMAAAQAEANAQKAPHKNKKRKK